MALGYVRPAKEADAAEIARIQLSTWRAAYADIVPADVLNALEEDWLARRWQDSCGNPPSPAHQVFVAIEQSETDHQKIQLVGFAAIGPGTGEEPDEPADSGSSTPAPEPGTGIVTELLVEPRFSRRGHGSRLLSAAVAHWRAHDISTVYAWSFARDAATLGFYKSAGWGVDGVRRTLDMGGQRVPQLRLHCDISDTDPQSEAGDQDPPGDVPDAANPA